MTIFLKFLVQSNFLEHNNINLVLNGVDTFSRILINDIEVGVTENMFVKYTFDVKPHLKVILPFTQCRLLYKNHCSLA